MHEVHRTGDWIVANSAAVAAIITAAVWLATFAIQQRTIHHWKGLVDVLNETLRIEKQAATLDLSKADGVAVAFHRELIGYRGAVRDLTANPTTIIIDPNRAAARNGEPFPMTEPLPQ